MINIGLKLWNTNIDNYLPLLTSLYEEKYFHYIELYVVPGHLDKIHLWKNLPIPFDIHAPHSAHNMNLSKSECFENNLKLYDEVKEYADELNARYIVFHGGVDGSHIEVAQQLQAINDTRTLIENKPYKTLNFIKGNKYIGAKIEEVRDILKICNCSFCLDIGHAICCANSFNINPYSYISEFIKLNPVKIHLSDMDITSEIDEHLNLGNGSIDYDKLFSIIYKQNDITIETSKKSTKNLDDFIEDSNFIRRYYEKIW